METSCLPLLNAWFEPNVSDTKSPVDWMPADKPTWTWQPVPMTSVYSAHSFPLPFGFHTWLWRNICLLLLILMLGHRQAIFESKWDKLSFSAECSIRTYSLRHQIASRLNARWQTDWAIVDQAKNLNSTARPHEMQMEYSGCDVFVTSDWQTYMAHTYLRMTKTKWQLIMQNEMYIGSFSKLSMVNMIISDPLYIFACHR